MTGKTRVWAIAGVLCVGIVAGGLTEYPTGSWRNGQEAWAQTTVPDAMIGFQSGQITAVKGNTVQINNKNYVLQGGVSIKDDQGNPVEMRDLVPGSEVKFDLKQGRIEQIILILPK